MRRYSRSGVIGNSLISIPSGESASAMALAIAAGAPMVPLAKGNSLVVYDNLGADLGHTIGFTEGAEATAPFENPTPVDAFNAAIIDEIFYTPPSA